MEAGGEAELGGGAITPEFDEPVGDLGDHLRLALRHVLPSNGRGSEPEVLEVVSSLGWAHHDREARVYSLVVL